MKIFNYCPSCGSRDIGYDNIKKFSCPACSFTYFQNVAAAAAAILEYDKRIIMIKRNREPAKGKLDLPGGFIDPNESAEDGLRREIREELQMELGKLTYLGSCPNVYEYKDVTYNTCDLFFHCKIDTFPTSFDTDEIEELVLIDPAEIPFDDIAFESIKKFFDQMSFEELKRTLGIG